MNATYEIFNDEFGSSCVGKIEEPQALESFGDEEDAIELKRDLGMNTRNELKGGVEEENARN